jgi:hypothetical protein
LHSASVIEAEAQSYTFRVFDWQGINKDALGGRRFDVDLVNEGVLAHEVPRHLISDRGVIHAVGK